MNLEDPNQWYLEGNKLMEQENYEPAIEKYNKALSLDSSFKMALLNKGDALLALGRYEDALKHYDEALNLDAQLVRALSGKAKVLYNLYKFEEALEVADMALSVGPGCIDALYCRGNIHSNLNDLDNAISFYNKALNIIKLDYLPTFTEKQLMPYHEYIEQEIEPVIAVPTDYSALIQLIPSDQKIIYSTLSDCTCIVGSNKIMKWKTHLLITHYGLAFSVPSRICKDPNRTAYYVRWGMVEKFQIVSTKHTGFAISDPNNARKYRKSNPERLRFAYRISPFTRTFNICCASDKKYESKDTFKTRAKQFVKKFRPILEQKHQDHAKHVLIGSKLYYEILKKRGNLQQMKAEKLIKVMDKIPKYKDYIKNHGFIDKDDYKQVVKKIKS